MSESFYKISIWELTFVLLKTEGQKKTMEELLAIKRGLTLEQYREFPSEQIDKEVRHAKTVVGDARIYLRVYYNIHLNTFLHQSVPWDLETKTMYQISTPHNYDDTIGQYIKECIKFQKAINLFIVSTGGSLAIKHLPPSTVDFLNQLKRDSQKLLTLEPFAHYYNRKD